MMDDHSPEDKEIMFHIRLLKKKAVNQETQLAEGCLRKDVIIRISLPTLYCGFHPRLNLYLTWLSQCESRRSHKANPLG